MISIKLGNWQAPISGHPQLVGPPSLLSLDRRHGSGYSRRLRNFRRVKAESLISAVEDDESMTTALPSRITSRVAIELYECILEHLHDSKYALSKCSTVCQDWLPICRRHLFHSVSLKPVLVERLMASTHAANTIVPHIRSVALGGRWLMQLEHDTVILFMKKLERLQELNLEAWVLDASTLSSLSAVQTKHCMTLTTLDLKYVTFPSLPLLTELIGSFVMLERLSFDNVTWDPLPPTILPPDVDSKHDSCPLPGLKYLSIHSSSNLDIVLWLFPPSISRDTVLSISTLLLPDLLPTESSSVATLLRAIGPSLTHLELGFLSGSGSNSVNSVEDALKALDLSQNTGLRTLQMHQITLYRLTPASSSVSTSSSSPYIGLVPLLSSILSHLTDVTLHLWLSEESHLEWILWRDVAELYRSRARYAGCSLTVEVRGIGRHRGDVYEWIRRRFEDDEVAGRVLRLRYEDE